MGFCGSIQPLSLTGDSGECWDYSCLILPSLTFSSLVKTLLWTPMGRTPLTEQPTNNERFRASCATLTAFNHWEKAGNVLILYPPTLPPRLPPVPLPLISPAVSGASVRCVERRCARVAERAGALHCSAHRFRWTSPNNGARQPGGGGGGDWTRSRSRTRRSTVALYSPLSENMSEFFLLAFLALFSGLFPCAEPSTVPDEEKGKEEPGRRGCAVRWNLAQRAVLVQSGVVTGAKCCAVARFKPLFSFQITIHKR